MLLPLVSLITLLPAKTFNYQTKVSICSVMLIICLLLCIWHTYSLFVLITNMKKWLQIWFTFNVNEKFMAPSLNIVGSRFFDIRKHLKYYDVTRDSLPHYPLLTHSQKQNILMKFDCEKISRARIILYTTRFFESVNEFTRNVIISLLVLSLLCAGIAMYELTVVIRYQ